jgi:hypothetical protein
MKAQYLVLMLTVSALPSIALAQKTVHSEAKPSTPATTTHSGATSASSPAEHKRAASIHSKTQAARFQELAVTLNLNANQKKSVVTLLQSASAELQAVRASNTLTPAEKQQATQGINLEVAQKFVGLLTPQQKKDLTELLTKGKHQTSNANSSSANSGAGGSAPDIPSIDVSTGSDSQDSNNSSSSTASSSTDATSADTTSGSSTPTTPANNDSGTTSTAVATQPVRPKANPSESTTTITAKPGRLTDAQLAAILNSFVQDEGGDSEKPGARPGS